MQRIYAQYNHGRWIAICPRCQGIGQTSAALVSPGDIFVCPEEYPDVLAKTLVPNPYQKGALNAVPDEHLRQQARQSAVTAGDGYEVVFPSEMREIEAVLRARPVHGRNWFPGVTLADLCDENERMNHA